MPTSPGAIAGQVIYALLCFGLFVLTSLQWASEYYIEASRRDVLIGKLMRLIHHYLWVGCVFQCVHSIDPFGELEIWTKNGANQWFSVNLAACIIYCAAAYILTIIDSVYSVLQEQTAPPIMTYTIKGSVIVIFLAGNISTLVATVLNRAWPTGINLMFLGPTFLVIFFILTYSSVRLRHLVLTIADTNTSVQSAVEKVRRTQIAGSFLLLGSGILGVVLGAQRLRSDQTLEEMLQPDQSGFKLLPFDWLMAAGVVLLLWYSYQPMYIFYTREQLAKVHRVQYPFAASPHAQPAAAAAATSDYDQMTASDDDYRSVPSGPNPSTPAAGTTAATATASSSSAAAGTAPLITTPAPLPPRSSATRDTQMYDDDHRLASVGIDDGE